jgi:RNA polymerase sigma-70 factor (ECF subfamily)
VDDPHRLLDETWSSTNRDAISRNVSFGEMGAATPPRSSEWNRFACCGHYVGMTSQWFGEQPGEWERARAGDPAAFGALFDAHRDRVLWQAMRMVDSFHDAEDIAGLVFLEAWRKRDFVRLVDGSVLPWLLVTTNYVSRNFARSLRRHRHAMQMLPEPQHQQDFAGSVDERIDAEPRRAAVRAAFARLSPKEQDVVSLCIIGEMSTADAAEALGIPAGTVKSRLSRARRKLVDLTAELGDPTSVTGGER